MFVMRGWDSEFQQWVNLKDPESVFEARRMAATSEFTYLELYEHVAPNSADVELVEVYTPYGSSLF